MKYQLNSNVRIVQFQDTFVLEKVFGILMKLF